MALFAFFYPEVFSVGLYSLCQVSEVKAPHVHMALSVALCFLLTVTNFYIRKYLFFF